MKTKKLSSKQLRQIRDALVKDLDEMLKQPMVGNFGRIMHYSIVKMKVELNSVEKQLRDLEKD